MLYQQTYIRAGNLLVDPISASIFIGEIDLSQHIRMPLTEYKLILFLARHVGRVCTAHEIALAIWGIEENGEVKTSHVAPLVARVRRRLEEHGDYTSIQSQRQGGYWMECVEA